MEWLRIAFTLCLFGNSFTEQRGNMTFGQWKHPHHDTIPVTKQLRLGKFAWDDCGARADVAHLRNLTILPDPVEIPGNLYVAASASTTGVINGPLQVTLTLKKKVSGTWVKIPCFYLPNCIYPDVCFLLDQLIPPGEDCPQPLLTYNLPCHCPFKKGNYTFPETPFYLPYFDLPTWLTNGMYQIQTVLTFNRVEVTCLKIVFSLKLS
uniref:GM2 ganglioside activator n=1 Tax=Eptatretus burgeri TaxID=7764 RepID=A0A8C4RCF7_EPTBU